MENFWIYFVILLMTYLGAQASVFFKKATGRRGLLECLRSYNLYVGGFLYLLCALLNIWVLRYLGYSKTLPLTSITYIWTLLLAYLIFKEKISLRKVLGIIAITIGTFLVAC